MTLNELNAVTQDSFVQTIGWVFEHSPWVAERAWQKRPFASLDALHAAMVHEVEQAHPEEQRSLLRAHPDLGARAGMSAASTAEQAGASLDRLTPEEYERFTRWNAAYKAKFQFPFLLAVKGSTKHDILKALEQRLDSTPAAEFRQALSQVYRIARFRLEECRRAIKIWGERVHYFASGWKRSYYGKGDVIVYRLQRDGGPPAGQSPVFGACVDMLLYGDAFWPTYITGDNSNLIATDSMKNFIQRETLNFPDGDLESYCRFLADRLLRTYPQTEGIQVSASEIPYTGIVDGSVAFAPAGPERATARVELRREGAELRMVEARSGVIGFKLLRLGGSSFQGFVRDEYTTLPEIANRPLHMWLDLDWTYIGTAAAFSEGKITARVRRMVHDVFHSFESGSIQQVIYQLGTKMLDEIPELAETHLEANNRTWDTVVEAGDRIGIYTEGRPPYGCLGLTLKR